MKNNNMIVHYHYTSSSTNSTSRNPPIFYPSSLQAKQPASSWGLASATWQEEKEAVIGPAGDFLPAQKKFKNQKGHEAQKIRGNSLMMTISRGQNCLAKVATVVTSYNQENLDHLECVSPIFSSFWPIVIFVEVNEGVVFGESFEVITKKAKSTITTVSTQ